MSKGPAVTAERLTKAFGDFTAVDEVSFEIRRGEVFGFLGPNGAGKTTTIRMLAGLMVPTSGRGTVAGYDISTEAEAIKQNIGYMSQLFSLYGDLTVEDNISFYSGIYRVPRGQRRQRREWVLEVAGLSRQRGRLTRELPLGFKQRLALGCAVIHEPPILFLDEPTSGVDPISRRSFWDLIYDLAGNGTTVFVTTHYMEEAEYCRRLALMNRGRLIALDTPARLRERMVLPILEVRTDDGPRAVSVLRGMPGLVDVGMFGRTVHAVVRDSELAGAEISRILESNGIRLLGLEKRPPSLEDVFVSLVKVEGDAVNA